jgi:predicted component of type VI protein secretion system
MDLALHAWKSGQLLTPSHFERQEEILLAHMSARFRLGSAAAHGIVSLELDFAELENGRVAIRRLTWLRRDGVLVSTDGNATLPAPLEIEGKGRSAVHLYVAEEPEQTASEGTELVPRMFGLALQEGLASSDWTRKAEESCQLLELVRAANGKSLQLGDFVPPLLQLGDSPFLVTVLRGLEQSVMEYNRGLLSQSHDASAVRERASDLQRRHVAGQRLLAVLSEAGLSPLRAPRAPVRLHPYALFRELRDYACELAAVPGSLIDPAALVYDHENLKGCYLRVISVIIAGAPAALVSPAGLEFEREGRTFILRQLTAEALDGGDLVLALSGADDVSALKLSSPSRLLRLHSALLPGLVLEEQKVRHAPSGGVETRYFAIRCSGEEWTHVQRERALAFQRLPGVGLSARLLWGAKSGAA